MGWRWPGPMPAAPRPPTPSLAPKPERGPPRRKRSPAAAGAGVRPLGTLPRPAAPLPPAKVALTPSQLSSVQYRGHTRHERASGRGEEGGAPSRARRQWSPRRSAGSRSRCEPPWASRRRSRRAQRGFGWGSGEESPTTRPPRRANTQRQPLCHSGTQVRSSAFCAVSWQRRAYVAHRAGVPWSPSTRRG